MAERWAAEALPPLLSALSYRPEISISFGREPSAFALSKIYGERVVHFVITPRDVRTFFVAGLPSIPGRAVLGVRNGYVYYAYERWGSIGGVGIDAVEKWMATARRH
jgi:hypothetical protein